MTDSADWSDVEGDVCPSCVPDQGLSGWIALEGAQISTCSFCGRSTHTASVEDLFNYMLSVIEREWSPASESDQIPFSHEFRDDPDFQPEEYETTDLLGLLDEPLGDDGRLRDMFCEALPEAWIHDDNWVGTARQNLEWSWEGFAEQLKSRTRFLILREPAKAAAPSVETPPHKMLDHLAHVIDQTDLIRVLPSGTLLFRGRKHRPDEVFTTSADLGAPHARYAEAQRMSPPGISFFYGSTDAETCLAELRGLQGELAIVGRWSSNRPLTILDLVDLPATPSIFDWIYGDIHDLVLFARWFVGQITKPVLAHDRPQVDYIPSQVVAEFIRFAMTSDDGASIDGIRFPSVAQRGGINLALFDGPALHEDDDPTLTLLDTLDYRAEDVSVRWLEH